MNQKEYMPIDAIRKYILSNYPYMIDDIDTVKFKDTEKQRAVYKVNTNKGFKCLKKVYYDEANLLFVYSVIQWFYSKGIKVPKFLPTKTGGRYVNYSGNFFILTDWIDGRRCDYDLDSDVAVAALNLGKMHKCSYDFKPIQGSLIRREESDWYNVFNKRHLQMLKFYNTASSLGDKFSKIFIDNFDYFQMRASHAVEVLNMIDTKKLMEPAKIHNTICHLDYVNKNLIITGTDEVYVIDFDKSKIDIPVHDIGTFLKRILKRKNTSWSFEILMLTLNSYEKQRELSTLEIMWLYAFLEFPQKFWKISRDYYNNKENCNKKMFINMLSEACAQKEDHDEFCNRFLDYIKNKYL